MIKYFGKNVDGALQKRPIYGILAVLRMGRLPESANSTGGGSL